jgi:hypothetical protein
MATTKERIQELSRSEAARAPVDRRAAEELDALETAWSAPARLDRPERPARARRGLGAVISPAWALGSALAWIVLLTVGYGVMPEPTAAELAQARPWLLAVLDWATLALLVGALVGFAARRRFGLAASLGSSAILVGFSVACPVTGHHETVGAWWGIQLACFAGLAAMSAIGLRRA